MVKLLEGKNIDRVSNLVYRIFRLQEFFTHIVEVNHPENISPCIYAMWHCHQMCIHGVKDRSRLNVLISRSRDGEIIARVVEKWGFKTIRGSKGKKGAVEASMQMISALKSGENCAMMVDGPHGPARIVKEGVVKLAKMAGVPIVPIFWYSENFNFAEFPSWDKLRMPILDTRLINLYGEPIYADDNDSDETIRIKLQESLENLERIAPQAYNEVYKFGLWKRKRSDSSPYKWNP